MPIFNESMRITLLRKTALYPEFLGYSLARHRDAEGFTPEDQAELLGIDLDGLTRLSLCKVPRPRHYQADLIAVSRSVGVDQDVLADILKSAKL